MSVINSLEICGFRNFSPDEKNKQVINFQKPLTLIVGDNGCGKSTIIEVLKYGLTSIFPTGSKQGHFFVHFPKLCNRPEATGRLRLEFCDPEKNRIVVKKGLKRCLRANSQPKCVRVESSVSVIGQNGKEVNVSGQIGKVDTEIYTKFGVTQSIIDSVIFCHQEDSTWPLNESKAVKERFDDLFSTSLFNDIINKIHSMIKKKTDVINEIEHEREKLLLVYKSYKGMQDEIDENCAFISRNKSEIERLRHEIENKKVISEQLDKKLKEMETLKVSSKQLDVDYQNVTKQFNKLNASIQSTFTGTDEELELQLNNLREVAAPEIDLMKQFEEKKRKFLDEKLKLKNIVQKKKSALDHLLSKKTFLENKKCELDKKIEEFKKRFQNDQNPLPEMTADGLEKFLQKRMQLFKSKLETVQDTKLRKQETLNNLHLEVSETNGLIAMRKTDIASIAGELAKIERAKETFADDHQIKLAKIEKLIEEKNVENSTRNLDETEKKIKENISKISNERALMKKEIAKLEKHAARFQEIRDKENEANSLYEAFHSIEVEHEAFLRKLDWKEKSSLESFLRPFSVTFATAIEQKKSELNKLQRELISDTAKRDKMKADISILKDTLNTSNEELEELETGSLETAIANCNLIIDETRKKIGLFDAMKYLYQNYLHDICTNSDSKCPLCKQTMSDEKRKKETMNRLQSFINCDMPRNISELESDLESERLKLEALMQRQEKTKETHSIKQTQLPSCINEYKELEKRIPEIKLKHDNCEKKLSELQVDFMELKMILKQSIGYDMKKMNFMELNKTIQSLKVQVSEAFGFMSFNDVKEKLDGDKEQLNTANLEIEKLRDSLANVIDRRSSLQSEWKRLVEKRDEIRKSNDEYAFSLNQIPHLIEKQNSLKQELINLESLRIANQSKYEEMKCEFENFVKSTQIALDKEQTEKNAIKNAIQSILQVMRSFKDDGSALSQDMDRLTQEIGELKRKKGTVKLLIAESENSMMPNVETAAANQVKLRDLEDQLALRDLKYELQCCKQKRLENNSKLNDLQLQKIPVCLKQVQNEIDNCNKEIFKLVGSNENRGKFHLIEKSNRLTGTILRLENRSASLAKEIKKQKFNNLEKQIKELTITVHVQEHWKENLKEYMKSLDWSLAQFHKDKIAEINEIIKQLWPKVYKGNDFKYIKIVTEEAKVTGGANRRSYNYRVVYVRNEIEMDMRGHCSAGQKALASIVIRMALAQIFCANCGILALDEPTSNLDKDNMIALSESLAELVKEKQKDNFQLILITHDEEFLQCMTSACDTDIYNRITRDESGNSLVLEN